MMTAVMHGDLKQGDAVQGLGQALKGTGQEGHFKLAQSQTMMSFNLAKWPVQFGTDGDDPPQLASHTSIRCAVLPIEPAAPIPVKLAGTTYLCTLTMDSAYQLG